MADIFISYSQADRPWVEKLARLIEGQGFSVWWDVKVLPGDEFGNMVLTEINAAKCVLVVWSQHSVNSDWVYGEADEARRAKKLVPVLKDEVSLPTAFRKIHSADMSQWDHQPQSAEFGLLLDAIRGRVQHVLEVSGAPASGAQAPPAGQRPIQPSYAAPGYVQPGYMRPGHVPPAYVPPAYVPPAYVPPAPQAPAVPLKDLMNGILENVARMNKVTLRIVAVAAVLLIVVKYMSWLSASYQNLTFWNLYWMLSEWAYAGIFAALAFSNKPVSPFLVRLFLWTGALTNALQICWIFISVDQPTPSLGLYCIAYVAYLGLFGAMAFTASASLAERLRPFALIAIVYYALLDASHSSVTGGADQVLLAFVAVVMHALEAIVVCMAPLNFAAKR